jgi:hypothetical protein
MKRVALYGAVFVLIHLAGKFLHGRAHMELQIGLRKEVRSYVDPKLGGV